MTNSATLSPQVSEILDGLLADAGVAGVQGLEVLRLVRIVAGAYDRLLNDAMRAEPVSVPRLRILLRLWVEERMGCGVVNPTHLSRTQQLSKNTISEHLRALEEDGLIARELDQDDRRQFRIFLTDAGRALVRSSAPSHAHMLNNLLAPLSLEEVSQLQHLLTKLHNALALHHAEGACQTQPTRSATQSTKGDV
jgi:DNA-binding MarR family transcriptional regulator